MAGGSDGAFINDKSFTFDMRIGHIRSGWRADVVLRGKRFTDARIAYYQRRGYYSQEVWDFRRELAERREKKRAKREGNFLITEGHAVYSPE